MLLSIYPQITDENSSELEVVDRRLDALTTATNYVKVNTVFSNSTVFGFPPETFIFPRCTQQTW